MFSCLPDKRAPGGAPFLARVFDGESMFGGVVCTSTPKPWRWGRVPRKEEKEVIPVVQGSAPACKPRQQDVAGNRVIY